MHQLSQGLLNSSSSWWSKMTTIIQDVFEQSDRIALVYCHLLFQICLCKVIAPIILESQINCKGTPKKSNVWQSSAIRCKVFVSRIARTHALARTQVQNGCTRLFWREFHVEGPLAHWPLSLFGPESIQNPKCLKLFLEIKDLFTSQRTF